MRCTRRVLREMHTTKILPRSIDEAARQRKLLARLKKSLPTSTAAFRIKCLEDGLTLTQARSAWIAELSEQTVSSATDTAHSAVQGDDWAPLLAVQAEDRGALLRSQGEERANLIVDQSDDRETMLLEQGDARSNLLVDQAEDADDFAEQLGVNPKPRTESASAAFLAPGKGFPALCPACESRQ